MISCTSNLPQHDTGDDLGTYVLSSTPPRLWVAFRFGGPVVFRKMLLAAFGRGEATG